MMELACSMVIHRDIPLIKDTLDSITTFVTKDINIIVDAHYWNDFRNWIINDIQLEKGFIHNFWRSPHRNVILSLIRTFEKYPNKDWYIYFEYDALFLNSYFIKDLEKSKSYILASDVRKTSNHPFPKEIEKLAENPIKEIRTMLGCCVFYRRNFIEQIYPFLIKFLEVIAQHQPGFFPNFPDPLEETLFPSLCASLFGSRSVEELSAWKGKWVGNKQSIYRLRCPDELLVSDIMLDTSIAHPLKTVDHPVRIHARRNRNKINKL